MSSGTVVLSGATGFVGRHLASGLLSGGYRVLILARADSDRSKMPRHPQASVVDVAELGSAQVQASLRQCAAWINAATAYGRNDSSDAELVESANVRYPLRILDSVIEAGCRTVIHFDSFFTKDALVHDYLPAYTAAKKEFVRQARARVASTDVSLFSLRLEHVDGPLDDPKKFVPWLLGQMLQDTPRIALTTGVQERDFVFVDDVVEATRAVLEGAPRVPGTVTTVPVGTGVKTSIRSMATLAATLCNSTSELAFGAVQAAGRGIESSCASTEYLEALGWKSQTPLAEGIERTIADLKLRAGIDSTLSAGQ